MNMVGLVIRTLRQCRPGVLLRVVCTNCKHQAEFIPSTIVGYVGRDLTFEQARRLFKCNECGSKAVTCRPVKPEPIRRWGEGEK